MMKGSMIVCLFFLLGCLIGFGVHIQLDTHNLSMYILYVLMFQVGINIGSNENLKGMLAHFTPKMLIIPLGTIVGTLLFSALASLLLSQWSVFASGFIFFAVNIVSIGYFQSVERARPAMMITVLRGFVFMVLCLFGLPLLLKVPGIWLAVPLAEILTFLVIMAIYYRKHQWVRR